MLGTDSLKLTFVRNYHVRPANLKDDPVKGVIKGVSASFGIDTTASVLTECGQKKDVNIKFDGVLFRSYGPFALAKLVVGMRVIVHGDFCLLFRTDTDKLLTLNETDIKGASGTVLELSGDRTENGKTSTMDATVFMADCGTVESLRLTISNVLFERLGLDGIRFHVRNRNVWVGDGSCVLYVDEVSALMWTPLPSQGTVPHLPAAS